MPRNYKRRLGAPLSQDYPPEALEKALHDVLDGRYSLRQDAELYNVSKGTISRKFHGQNIGKFGTPPALSAKEEQKVVFAITFAAFSGFPFTSKALRKYMQGYLNRKRIAIRDFNENLPGIDWLRHFRKKKLRIVNQVS
ncbi:hypothetical protein ILUMI_16319 [Ignelater luminosus]|uniref:HTH psq-type domain-containing protein n=1 Tax=Ignelater luminosus TaxID=2038154 RepID=A0A8K0CLY7_IGNLU|nr:hypothetical protein ILUMI_16319 [Ignelater luminosus]